MGLFDSFFGGGESETKSEPWEGVQDYLRDLYAESQGAFEQGPYYGDRNATISPMSSLGLQGTLDHVTGQGADLANMAAMSGMYGAQDLAQSGYNAGQFAQGDFSVDRAAAAGMSLEDYMNASQGMYGSTIPGAIGGTYDVMDRAGQSRIDPTLAYASAYGDNPYMDSMVDAASRDVSRNLYENTLPGLNMQASAGGTLNSSRAGMAEAIATRGAADRIGDIGGQLRGGAYSQGLNLGGQQISDQFGQQLGAASKLGDLAGMGLSANMSGQGLMENMYRGDLDATLSANEMLGKAGATGTGMIPTAYNIGSGLNNELFQAGGVQGAGDQAELDNAFWNNYQAPWDVLGQYNDILGATGMPGTNSQTDGQSPFQTILGGASTIAGLGGASGFDWWS